MNFKFFLSLALFLLSINLSIQNVASHSTVCNLLNGTKALCPIKDAECCEGSDFCCPKGFECDLSNQRCIKDSLFIPFHLRLSEIKTKQKNDLLCPDKVTTCKDTQTCCQYEGDDYGCCPLANAVCCEDKTHCCPSGYTCNPAEGKCDRNKDTSGIFKSIDWKKKHPGIKKKTKLDVVCPGGGAQCPSGTTCCQLSSGEYGCCPIPNAVCCNDHLHCCPSGYTCDVADGRCNKGDVSLPFYKKIESKKLNKNVDEVCPGGDTQCPAGTTCCQMDGGEYGCCPLPNAVCCSDHLHCCPSGYTCDVADGRCNKGDVSLPFYKKIEAKKNIKIKETVVCPGGSGAECPTGTTCCQLSSGEFGCCPLENAVCCSDHLHCCPSGYTCDVADGRCNKGDVSLPFYKKIEAIKTKVDVVCPGGGAQCPSGTTCCQLSSGEYGCCPLPNAVCCNDHLHCCPSGYTCDVADGRCNKGDVSLPFYKKIEAISLKKEKKDNLSLTSVVCPDGSSFCPRDYTCCKMADSSYGCCPLENAICCSDNLHCCPHNTRCNLEKQSCETENYGVFVNWFEKASSKKLSVDKKIGNVLVDPVLCPDNSTCDPLKTCCLLSNLGNSYGCCPYSDGVCCPDFNYCCPGNTKCGVKYGECTPINQMVKPGFLLNWHTVEDKAQNIEDAKFKNTDSCSISQTKCLNSFGNYSCCPYNNGTCCGSEGWCCPEQYTCDPTLITCIYNDPDSKKVDKEIMSTKLVSAKKTNTKLNKFLTLLRNENTVGCPNQNYLCSSSYTCCSDPSSDSDAYECCPLENAVCCGDGINCCPNGYSCGNGSKTGCIKNK